jgi:hypothetical protein
MARTFSIPQGGFSNMSEKRFSRRSVLAGLPIAGTLIGSALSAPASADQPHMQRALDALRTADRELADAERDKGGHRNRAQALVRRAIAEVERGVTFDRRH